VIVKIKWRRWTYSSGEVRLSATCPWCGAEERMDRHTVLPNGMVDPSFVCPFNNCGFHEYVVLENWSAG
jgi:hypothetical protein